MKAGHECTILRWNIRHCPILNVPSRLCNLTLIITSTGVRLSKFEDGRGSMYGTLDEDLVCRHLECSQWIWDIGINTGLNETAEIRRKWVQCTILRENIR